MDLAELALDPDKELKGVWVPFDKQTQCLIARMDNPDFLEMRTALMEPIVAQGKGEISDAEADEVLNKCIAKTILLDWKGLFMGGVELEYNYDLCLKILSDERFRWFKERVVLESHKQANYRTELLESDLGNFVSSSTTQADGQKSGKSSSKTSKKRSRG